MIEEIDSLPELIFYITNTGNIVAAIYFVVVAKKAISKLLLSLPAVVLYVATPIAKLFGCNFEWFSSATCREWFWLYILVSPTVFLVYLVVLAIYKWRFRGPMSNR